MLEVPRWGIIETSGDITALGDDYRRNEYYRGILLQAAPGVLLMFSALYWVVESMCKQLKARHTGQDPHDKHWLLHLLPTRVQDLLKRATSVLLKITCIVGVIALVMGLASVSSLQVSTERTLDGVHDLTLEARTTLDDILTDIDAFRLAIDMQRQDIEAVQLVQPTANMSINAMVVIASIAHARDSIRGALLHESLNASMDSAQLAILAIRVDYVDPAYKVVQPIRDSYPYGVVTGVAVVLLVAMMAFILVGWTRVKWSHACASLLVGWLTSLLLVAMPLPVSVLLNDGCGYIHDQEARVHPDSFPVVWSCLHDGDMLLAAGFNLSLYSNISFTEHVVVTDHMPASPNPQTDDMYVRMQESIDAIEAVRTGSAVQRLHSLASRATCTTLLPYLRGLQHTLCTNVCGALQLLAFSATLLVLSYVFHSLLTPVPLLSYTAVSTRVK